jgi:uroporphyrinogen-III decarboxylase
VGLVVDSPWLPGWAGDSIIDYFAHGQCWLDANLKAVEEFRDVMLLPGFWSEFGMCTEPSAFGAKSIWPKDTFPSVERMLYDYSEVSRVKKPDCRTDGLLPFVLRRLEYYRPAIEKAGHRIRFSVARGPLNIASYLLGHTELLLGIKTNPEQIHELLDVITEFLEDWISLQADTFESIDGIFVLDDLIGFLGDDDFRQFALPYLKRVFGCRDVSVRFLHNDAPGLVTSRHLAAMGVNFFNFSNNHTLAEIRGLAGESVVLLGNIPPRDILAAGTPQDVCRAVAESLATLEDNRRVIISCGGGTPPDVPTENIKALSHAASSASTSC